MDNQYAQHKNRSLSTNKIGNKWKNHNIFNGNRKIMNLKIGKVFDEAEYEERSDVKVNVFHRRKRFLSDQMSSQDILKSECSVKIGELKDDDIPIKKKISNTSNKKTKTYVILSIICITTIFGILAYVFKYKIVQSKKNV